MTQTAPALAADKDFIASNVIHILYHEFGHALISEFELPVIGQEEDAVDVFATLELIDADPEDAEAVIGDVAEAHLIMHDRAEDEGSVDFYDEHDVDAQRGYRAICMLYGSDPEQHVESADWIELPEDRRETCEADYQIAADSWAGLLEDHARKASTATVNPIIEPTDTARDARALLVSLDLLGPIAAEFQDTYDWPRDLTLVARECGEANAYWDPDIGEIAICYELIDDLIDLDAARDHSN